ncbi:acyl-CoA thioesterase [Gillisia sp. M10.2A]|uniref:Acyl-CoA thioesterase n=1 Tax=Gillisia lutea TaxID=2909668 RepID=A0ABS9EC07_9FLAO|nr:acyl-CoA thioesterase [Gillisia lutea]MCF4100422.1 acyl-CoA thioesterase [Gillisia lutea]
MSFEEYKLSLEIRIDWSDLDTYSHVNNLVFMRIMQSGRVNFWEATGLAKDYDQMKKGPMLVSTHCDFKKSLYYPGTATIKTKLLYMKNSSFCLEHVILNDKEEVCAVGKDVAVCFDFNLEKTYRIPEDLREIMSGY